MKVKVHFMFSSSSLWSSYNFFCIFEMKFFSFPKKLQVLDQVHFKKNDWIRPTCFWHFWKKLQRLDQVQTFKACPFGSGLKKFGLDPVVVIFFKKCQKNYKCWSDPVGVIIFEMHLIQRLNQPTLVIFLTFFEKKYKDWIKSKLFKSRFKWTGLVAPTFWN